jgi:hypothetical protein
MPPPPPATPDEDDEDDDEEDDDVDDADADDAPPAPPASPFVIISLGALIKEQPAASPKPLRSVVPTKNQSLFMRPS